MSPLFSEKKAVKFTKKEYNESDKSFPYYCPIEKPYLATINSELFGLCVEKIEDLDKNTSMSEIPIYVGSNNCIEIGKKYGYITDHMKSWGGYTELVYEKDNDIYDFVPKNFKIITYNIWGLHNHHSNKTKQEFKLHLMDLRMKELAKILKECDADLVCLQEMSNESLEFLTKYMDSFYQHRYELDFDIIRDFNKKQRTVDVYFMSKHKPKNVKIYSVSGNLGYNNSFMIIEYPNLIIFNAYMQAGSKYSPGQDTNWFHYSRCRMQEYKAIGQYLEKYNKLNVPIIWLGDFNAHLDGDFLEWPELAVLQDIGLADAWSINKNNPGYTEDTILNTMRWNYKFIEKQFRYDGILYLKNDTIEPINTKIIGTEHILLNKQDSQMFYDLVVPNTTNKKEMVRYCDEFCLFPSDHFGVICEFVHNNS